MLRRINAIILVFTTLLSIPVFVQADTDMIVFGSYEQDGNQDNGKEPIEWIVLKKDGNRLLLISQYALDCKKYNEEYTDTDWENCTLRSWLNSDFLNTAFSKEEQKSILKASVVNASSSCNPNWKTNGGNNTSDNIYLLSFAEYNRYFQNKDDTCYGTNYAKKQGAKILFSQNCTWWLRSPGKKQDCASTVGIGEADSTFVAYDSVGIRPVLWINTTAYKNEPQNSGEHDITSEFILNGTDEYGALGGTVIGNQSTTNITAGEEVFHANQGHGFAAESANIQAAADAGDDVTHTGGSNIKDGPDYQIINGNTIIQVQTKYCKTANETINACFEDGLFRYMADENTPMFIEVPKDQYNRAVELMEDRITKGQVPGVSDPAEAKNIIRPGAVTYQQAKNLAKAGTIESLKYDAKNSIVSCTTAFGISATVRFATSIWAHDDIETALENSLYTGLSIGGNAFITGVLAGQLVKAGLNSALVPTSEAIINFVGPKASAVIVNAARLGTTPIYGAAAMKSAAKLLRGNIITSTIAIALFTVPNVVEMFRGRVSGKQLFKELATTTGGIAGGMAGGAAGVAVGGVAGAAASAATGALLGSIVPGIGNIVGGVVGGAIGIAGAVGGAIAGSAATEAVVGLFVEDDAEEMLDILSDEFQILADEYLLNQEEAEKVSKILQSKLTGEILKDMFASNDRYLYARNLIEPTVIAVTKSRQIITMPSDDLIAEELIDTLEKISSMDLSQMEVE